MTNKTLCESKSELVLDDIELAAYEYVEKKAVLASDGFINGGYYWHGCRLRDAFRAGVEWQKKHRGK